MKSRLRFVGIVLFGLATVAVPAPARAATTTVTCSTPDLKDKLIAANANLDADTLELAPGCRGTVPDDCAPAGSVRHCRH